MFLRELRVRGVKLLRNFELSFLGVDGAPRQWTVLVGENGLCKTTVLQSIALAASGHTQANRLAEKLVFALPDKRTPHGEARIELDLGFRPDYHGIRKYPGIDASPSPPIVRSQLTLVPGDSAFTARSSYLGAPADVLVTESGDAITTEAGEAIGADQNPLDRAQRSNEPHWFIAGYGVGRNLPEPTSTGREERVRSIDRVRSLFDTRYQIFGTDFVDRFNAEEAREFVKVLRHVLVAGGILPRVKSIELRGAGGISKSERLVESHRFEIEVTAGRTIKVPATWLSQGYQGTISWVADVIGQILLEATQRVDPSDMEGIVLIDEIDLHLHPRWQRTLVQALSDVFPKIQFVATTHSPMILPALAQDEVWRLRRDPEGSVRAEAAGESPHGMSGTEIYEAFFDLPPRDRDIERALDVYGRLSLDPDRSEEEERTMLEARQKLVQAGVEPGWNPIPRASAEP